MQTEIKNIAKKLELLPHPEGGFYRETYRSEIVMPQEILGEEFSSNRNVSTCIYFMLTSDSFSAFHRIKQDEIWHFYRGSAINLYLISPVGEFSVLKIGNDILNDEVPQFVVPAEYWFAAEVVEKDSYSLVGCTVAPGFDFADFELAEKDKLRKLFPNQEDIIKKLCR
ncbi:MAG TPA: cupin domain-containing protein [Bacteroidales bacterium]|nr:cupin domain-containing protein [Bacteroidales bacterium]